ncbi:MAG TPA: PAS domain S-box protein, partial [Candidatus Binatia bacterium]|nr:PAS domain S-box protein [Candidatus Binatia bacterium]
TLLEYQKSEVVGKNWFDIFVSEAIREEARLSFHQLLDGSNRRGHAEKRVLTKSGQECVVSWHFLPVKDEKGRFAGAILSGQDVTDHRLAEERFVRLASFPAFDPNPVVEVDFDGSVTYTNPATKKMFPNLEKKGLNQPFFSDWKKILAAFKGKISMDTSFGREIRLGDNWYLQQFSFMPIGPRIRIYVVNVDEKKRAEEALKESEEKYRSLFENMINGYAYCKMIFDETGEPVDFVYLEINDAFEKLTGLKRQAVVGRKVSEAIPGTKEANPEIFGIYGRVAQTGKAETFEVYFKPLSLWLNISVYGPKKGYFVAIFENITKRKELEAELNSYNKRLEEVVAQRTAEYSQTNEKLTREIMERRKTEEGLLFRAMILDNLSEAIFLTNLRGVFVYTNLAACALFGNSCEAFLGLNFLDLLQLPETQKKEIMENLFRNEQIEFRTIHVKKDKVKVPIQLRSSIINMRHGKFIISVIHKTA